jgi:hypothetical protein
MNKIWRIWKALFCKQNIMDAILTDKNIFFWKKINENSKMFWISSFSLRTFTKRNKNSKISEQAESQKNINGRNENYWI